MTGVIVAFEGLPGCGKSSIAKEIAGEFEDCVIIPEVSETAASKGFEVADRASIGTEAWFLTQYYTRDVEAGGSRPRGSSSSRTGTTPAAWRSVTPTS